MMYIYTITYNANICVIDLRSCHVVATGCAEEAGSGDLQLLGLHEV